MIQDKIEILKQKIGEKKTTQILDMIIGTYSDFDNDILLKIKHLLTEKYHLSETKIVSDVNHIEVKRIYTYLISEFTKLRNKDIALIIKSSERNVYRYKKNIKEILRISEKSAIRKHYEERISNINDLKESLFNYKKQKIKEWNN